MARWAYKRFRIKELDWWLNLYDSPNEINNKQCLESLNFNFSGNKLVSWENYSSVYDTTETIYAMNDIDGDFYYLSGTGLYKNENKIDTSGKSVYLEWELNIWTTYGVTINWITYSKNIVGGDTVQSVFDSLVTQINAVSNIWAEVWFININSADYPSINLFGTLTTVSGINLSIYEGLVIAWITDGQILKNWLDIIIIWNWKWYFLQKVVKDSDVTNIWYIVQEIPFKEKPIQWMTYWWKLFYITWNSNILYFSKTADALYNARVKDFWNEELWELYDAWLQMVWWDWAITWLLAWENWIYVFKKNEVFYSNSVNDDGVGFTFVMNRIASNWAENYKAIVTVKQDTFYFDSNEKALKRLSYEQNLTTLRDTSVSNVLWDKLDTYSNIQLWYKYPNIYIYSPTNNTIVYNVDNKSFTEYELWTIDKISWKYLSLWSTIYTFWWTPFTSWTWLSKEYDLWDAIDEKRFWEIEVYWKFLGLTNAYLDVYINWVLKETVELTLSNWDYFRRRFNLFDRWRYIQFWIKFENNEYLEINEVNINFKPLKSYKYN